MAASDSLFAAQVADPARHAVADFSPDSATLLVLFGGIAGGVSMPVYEFFRVTDGYPVKRLFLRDPRYSWYLRGLPDVGDDATSIESAMADAIRQSGASRVIMAGASAGGFAAIRFAARLGAERAIAFSPQTFIDASQREAVGDGRWHDQIVSLHGALGPQAPDYDVRPLVADVPDLRCDIHVSTDDPLDIVHARRLADLPNVTIAEYAGGGHKLVRWLRDNGHLREILTEALGAPEDVRPS
jgi:pimeloyl-ACP methyl ester carboxylesterase